MARRSHKMVVWLPSIFVVMTVLIAIQFWWCYDYLRTTASQEVDYKNQTYFDHTLVKIQNADARSLGFVSYHDFRFSPHRTSHIVSPIEIRRSLLLLLSGFFYTMDYLGLREAWIAHDTLLGHHFGHHLLPWKTSINVQASRNNVSVSLWSLQSDKT